MTVEHIDKQPRLVALCGNPLSGKTTAQKILLELGYDSIDDGFPLRNFAVNHLGLSWDDVLTQEGKAGSSEICGKTWNHRKALGEIGNALEATFGESILPWIALNALPTGVKASFGSVRKSQGAFLRRHGALVIGILNPLASPSGNKFDLFDTDAVDVWVTNDHLAGGHSEDVAWQRFADQIEAVLRGADYPGVEWAR